jgi:DNA-directed RNA polymerase specialized sigma subunit
MAMKLKETRDIKDVWVEYKRTRTEALRNVLMEHYLHLVRYNATTPSASTPSSPTRSSSTT